MPSLINMENTAQEAAQQTGAIATADNLPKYPWGLELCLNDDVLEKLGVKTLPAVGTEVTIVAKACVSSTRESATEGDGAQQNMSLQITDMQVDGLDADLFGRAADLLYGKKK
jgi:hypothetical protein